MTQGSYNIIFDLGTVVGKGSCSDMCRLHQQPTLTIFSNRGGCSAEGSFFDLTLCLLNLLVEFLGGFGIKSHPLSISIFNASSEILDAVKCHSPVLGDLLFLSAHSVTSWIFCFTAAVLLFYQTSRFSARMSILASAAMGLAIGHHASPFFGLGSVSTFGNILLKPGVGEEYATIRNILNIGNLSVISGSIESGNADAKNLSCFLTSDKSFHQLSSNLSILLIRPSRASAIFCTRPFS